jgi:hypothetical protein
MDRQISVSAYITCLWKNWTGRMTGPISILFTVLALYVDDSWEKLFLFVVALVSGFIAAYAVWKHEREELNKALDQIRLKLQIEFIPTLDAYFEPTITFKNEMGGDTTQQRALISLRNIGLKTVSEVEVFCIDLEVQRVNQRPYQVVYTQKEFRRQLTPDEPLFVGVVRHLIGQDKTAFQCSRKFEIQVPRKRQLETPIGNEFIITLLIVGDDIPGQQARFHFGEKNDVFFFKRLN